MLGCTLGPNTSMHGVEELSKPWYLLTEDKTEYTLIDEDGNKTLKSYWCHNFSGNRVWQRYKRVENIMEIPSGKVLEAECFLIDASKLWEEGDKKLKENCDYFIEYME